VILFLNDPVFSRKLSLQINQFGYKAHTCSSITEVREYLEDDLAGAIITETGLLRKKMGLSEEISELRTRFSIPLVFISDTGNFGIRLQAIRTGGDFFLLKPVNIMELVEALDMITGRKKSEPYRVLIVDDEEKMALYHSIILKKAGMETTTIDNPEKIFESLVEFNPDLILMDMYMPLCTGQELARLIRQMKAYHSIPIVYLSAERDRDIQLHAMKVGGDDFLTKPVEPDHLVSSVTTRAERMRTLRSLMERDSLTGLLNHRRLKEELDISTARYAREQGEFAFVMIDIDHFKSVNDRYGHASGDTVIVSLSRLLQQRLRKSDIIGRYGGEEFAVILHNTNGRAAKEIMDDIREGFGRIIFAKDETDFTVTFSAGIASFPEHQDPNRLISHADQALYQAKKLGRNRIILDQGRDEW